MSRSPSHPAKRTMLWINFVGGVAVLGSYGWGIRMLAAPSAGLWITIRVVLALVGFRSVGVLAALFAIGPGRSRVGHMLAIVGAAAFVVQATILDALVWPEYFPAS